MAETTVGQIGLDLTVNQKQFNKQMKGIESLATKVGRKLAGAFAVKKLVDFGKACIDLGSDLQEVQNVVDVTFPNMSKRVDEFAKDAASSFGLSETMAKKFSGTFGAMAKAFGFSESKAYDMSTALTGLAGDVASFYNITQDEAYTKLKSVFTGETESLKDLGVVMTQSALDAYALANGYGKTTSAMSEAEKVALRYAFVQNQLSAASGDFRRTSDGWANQVRVLQLRFDSLKATIGQGLINLFTPVLRVINTLLGKITVLADAFKSFTELITGNKASTSSGISQTAKATSELEKQATGVGKAAKKASKEMRSLLGIDEINKLSSSDDSSEADSGSGAVGSGGASVDFGSLAQGETVIDKVDSKFQKFIDKMRTSFAPLSEQIQRFVGIAKDAFGWLLDNVLTPLASFTINEIIPRFFETLANILGIFNNVLIALQPLWQWFWEKILQPIVSWTGGIFLTIWDGINGALKRFSDWCAENPKVIETMAIAIGSFFAAFKIMGLIEGIAKVIAIGSSLIAKVGAFVTACGGIIGVVTKIGGLIGTVLNPWTIAIGALIAAGVLLYKNWDTVKEFALVAWNKIKEGFVTATNKIKEVFGNVVNWFKEKYNAIKNTFSSVGTWFKDKFSSAYNSVKTAFGSVGSWFKEKYNSIKTVFNDIKAWFSEKFTNAYNALKKPFQSIGTFFDGIRNTIKNKFKSIGTVAGDAIGGAFKSVINSVLKTVESTINKAINFINSAIGVINKIPGVNVGKVKTVSLPRLAEGGFVKKNTPQLAIIGDNRHQGEVVAPEGKLEQMALKAAQTAIESIMQVAMATNSGGSDNKPYVINVVVKTENDEVLARAVERGNMSRDWRYNPTPAY